MVWVHRLILGLIVVLCACGCAVCPGEPPHGPGATSETNLRPWLGGAPLVSYTGRLQYFHCTSERGNFYTWSLDPCGQEDAAEVDVRACAADARRLENRRVTVTGRMIERDKHFPIFVAERIEPVDAPPQVTSTMLTSLDAELNLLLGM